MPNIEEETEIRGGSAKIININDIDVDIDWGYTEKTSTKQIGTTLDVPVLQVLNTK